MNRTRSPETFAAALVSARKQLGLSMLGLGRRVGVTGRTVARWESGKFTPGYRERLLLIDVLAPAGPDVERVLRATLDVPVSPTASLPRALSPEATSRLIVDGALVAMAEAVPQASIASLRIALHNALERLRADGLDMARAAAILRAPHAES
jgi:transcriptional regulator with XRE-family HTH domain